MSELLNHEDTERTENHRDDFKKTGAKLLLHLGEFSRIIFRIFKSKIIQNIK